MQLDLNDDELQLLHRELERHVKEMETELVRTDAPAMQHALGREVAMLTRIRDRLNALVKDSQAGVWVRGHPHP